LHNHEPLKQQTAQKSRNIFSLSAAQLIVLEYFIQQRNNTERAETFVRRHFLNNDTCTKDVHIVSWLEVGVLRRANTFLRVNGTRSVRSRVRY
jgi:hypothetical protein